jgi:hypothetical protein
MSLTRRGLFRVLAAAAGAGGAVYVARPGPVRSWVHRLVVPSLADAPVGPINPQALNALLAAAETLIEYPIDTARYADFFRWRAEHLRGHRALYERFAATVNHAAAQARGCEFAACEPAARRKILAARFEVRAARGRVARLRVSVREHDWPLFDAYIVRPTTLLFASTDAWRVAGYGAWPGTPRGLEEYLRGPSARKALRLRSHGFVGG